MVEEEGSDLRDRLRLIVQGLGLKVGCKGVSEESYLAKQIDPGAFAKDEGDLRHP